MYNIITASILFRKNNIAKITVVVEMSKGDIRTIQATDKPTDGYMHIQPGAKISDELLQKVAGYGKEYLDNCSMRRSIN